MTNKTNAQKPSVITDFLITFFEEKMSQLYPRATYTVRTEAGKTELQDTDDIVKLPTYWIKRRIYDTFVRKLVYQYQLKGRKGIELV